MRRPARRPRPLRAPAQEADRRAQRLETEARTLAKMLASGGGERWPRAIDRLSASAATRRRWGRPWATTSTPRSTPPRRPTGPRPGAGEGDPALPAGARALSEVVAAPAALARRLRQVGVVDRAHGAAPARLPQAGPAPRVARGRSLALGRPHRRRRGADAAARRLAERNRLGELKGEAQAAREAAERLRHEGEIADAAVRAAAQDETMGFETTR